MATHKKIATRRRASAKDPLAKVLDARRKAPVPKPARIADRKVLQWAKTQLGPNYGGNKPRNDPLPNIEPALELTPRMPHGPQGHMDLYRPGRWDCSANLIFMRPIVQESSPGDWDGSVAYVKLKAPDAGSYLVAAVFAGFSSPQGGQGLVLKINGPWGSNSASGQSTEDGGPVAIWNAAAGDSLSFTVTCTGGVIAYLQSIRLYAIG
jgi:hypothetical protein